MVLFTFMLRSISYIVLIIYRVLLELPFKFCFERELVINDLGIFVLGYAFGKTLSVLRQSVFVRR